MKVVKREEVTPSRTCKQHKTSNLDNLPKKTIKQSTKSLEKIRQAGKYKYNAKMQKSKQKKQHTIVQCGCDHTVQMQNENKQKKLQHSFANYAIKTIVINAVQKPIRRERGAKKQKKKSGTNKTQENA